MAGTEDLPYTSSITIELIGTRTSPNLVIDELSSTGTKSFFAPQGLVFNVPTPEQIHTRLYENAAPGDTSIKVLEASGWAVDDTIVIGGSS
jgi:hypothetical protein